LSHVSAHRITFVGPPALALQVVTALADGDGVDLTSSEPPRPHGHGIVTLDVTVDGSRADVSSAVGRVRATLPDGASLDVAADA
jgi:hypothetical protein